MLSILLTDLRSPFHTTCSHSSSHFRSLPTSLCSASLISGLSSFTMESMLRILRSSMAQLATLCIVSSQLPAVTIEIHILTKTSRPLLQLQLWTIHNALGSSRRKLQKAKRGAFQERDKNGCRRVESSSKRDGRDTARS